LCITHNSRTQLYFT